MPVPVEIPFRNCEPDEEVREHILREAGRLFECHPRPSGCSVAIERLASHGMGPPRLRRRPARHHPGTG